MRNRKKPELTGYLRALVLMLLIGQCVRVAFASPRLRLEKVTVTGTQRLTQAQVLDLTHLRLHENVFHVDLHRTARILQQVPSVKSVVVSRILPDTLQIDLTERQPAYQIQVNSKLWIADKDGVIYETAAARQPKLPLLEARPEDLPALGKPLNKELLETVRTCYAEAAKKGLQLTSLRVDANRELWLHIANRPKGALPGAPTPELRVRMARSTDLAAKFVDLEQALLAMPDLASKASYLVVMCAGQPSYMPLKPSEQASGRTHNTSLSH